MEVNVNESSGPARRLKWWQIALLSIAVSALGGLSGRRSKKQERKLYNKELKQAPWAPPAWLFAPAWTINNYFLLQALKKLLSTPNSNSKKLLRLQAIIWVIFFSFNYIYFNKKSTLLAALWTAGDTALALASFAIAMKWDKKLAAHYLPLLGWTGFASTLAGYQALTNRDEWLHTPPLLSWIKK